MSNLAQQYASYIDTINEEETLYALQNSDGEWVVCDSADFEEADVFPLWANEQDAQAFCIDEWQEYKVASIQLDDLLEEWISDFHSDGVLIGIDWQLDQDGVEMDAIEYAKLLVKAL